jgi:hypothetical protein
MSGMITGSAASKGSAVDEDIPEILRGDDDLPQVLADTFTDFFHAPRARGLIHLVCAATAIVAGAVLVPVAWLVASPKAGLATLVYTATIVGMFTVSAIYHRVQWKSLDARKWMKRADHSMIFIFIAGSYTPFVLLAMPPRTAELVLTIVYAGAAAGVALKMFWPSSPRWVARLRGHLVRADASVRWWRRRRRPAARRWGAVQHRSRALWRAMAQPVATDVRLSRVLPRVHRCGSDLPLHRDLVRRSPIGRSRSAI